MDPEVNTWSKELSTLSFFKPTAVALAGFLALVLMSGLLAGSLSSGYVNRFMERGCFEKPSRIRSVIFTYKWGCWLGGKVGEKYHYENP